MAARPGWPRARMLVLAAIVVGVAARLAFAFGYWTNQPLTHDEREYLAIAANLAQGRGFARDLPLDPRPALADTFDRAPIYPLLIAPLTRFDADLRDGRYPPSVPVAIKLAQCLAGALLILAVAALARRAGGPAAAALAAWIAALHPALTWMPAYALSEALFVPMALGAVLALGRVTDRATRATTPATVGHRAVLVAGALTGLAILTRPATIFLVPLAALWLLVRHRALAAVLFVAASTLVVAPWTARNVVEHQRLVLVSSQGGVNFWIGNHPLAVGDGDLAANPQIKAANLALRARHEGLSPEELEPVYYREAFEWIRAEPLAWFGLLARKAYYTVVPTGPSYRLHSPLYHWASVLPYLLLLPLATLGVRTAVRSAAPPVALLLLVASSVVSSIVFFPHERFRIPVVDPALVVFAATWLATTRPFRTGAS